MRQKKRNDLARQRRSGSSMLLAVLASALVAMSITLFLNLSGIQRRAVRRNVSVKNKQDANGSAIEIANSLIRAGNIQGFVSTDPVGTYYMAVHSPMAATPGGFWQFSNGYLRNDGIAPVAQLTVFVCNVKFLSPAALNGLFSPTPTLPPPSSCDPATPPNSNGQPAAFRHEIVFVSRQPSGSLQLEATVLAP